MRTVPAAVVAACLAAPVMADSIDGRVIQVRMPVQNVSVLYVESAGAMSFRLETGSASVSGTRAYVGDGEVALELVAHELNGLFLQGEKLPQGSDLFKKGGTVHVKPGYKKAADLKPGDLYITIPAVAFELPMK